MGLYLVPNYPMQTTAAPSGVSTGTAIKTMLQVKPFNVCEIVEWGISFNAYTPSTPITVELIETDVAATVTASADADITKVGPRVADMAVASVAGLTLSTSATGYTATVEGTITSVRNLDVTQYVTNTVSPLKIQYSLGNEPTIQIGKFGRIRVTAPTAVNCFCYMILRI